MAKCEQCGKTESGFQLNDYCAECSRNLCEQCMVEGCCGHVPAKSGTEDDHSDDDLPPTDKAQAVRS